MKHFKKLLLSTNATLTQAMQAIDDGACKLALVVDQENTLLGTISDGDIRRAILKGIDLEDSISGLYNEKPITAAPETGKSVLLEIAYKNSISKIPIVDSKGRLLALETLDELIHPKHRPNKVVLMVGGLGSRLKPLTDKTPKPMLNVGGKPILETIINRFVDHGFVNIVLCVNYKSEMIKDYFGDGARFGASIEYVLEDKRMGTAGALTLLPEAPEEPFFVMNGDLLTNINFENILDYHTQNESVATMCVREYDFQVPFGVVNLEGNNITSIEEKPTHSFFVSAGIYMLDPSCIDRVPSDQFYDMPTLFDDLIKVNSKLISFPLREYWLDIGRMEEYEKANSDYNGIFN